MSVALAVLTVLVGAAVFAVTGSHVVMASVMAMTPVHLAHLAPSHVTVVVGFTIALSVLVHGVTATPVMRRLEQRAERRLRELSSAT